MSEVIYNLFAYSDGKIISHIGIVSYKVDSEDSDDNKLNFLKKRSSIDHIDAYKARIVSPEITLDDFALRQRKGTAGELFEELFQHMNAPPDPLVVMTIIENGKARVEGIFSGATYHDIEGRYKMIDYLSHYKQEQGIDFSRMIDDDYFKAIKLLFNNGFIVSSVKLLMIFIDTIAFIEFGDKTGNFKEWLDTFALLKEIDLEANELWEFRNGILHMSNLDSRNVLNGKVMRLIPCVNLGSTVVDTKCREKQFDLLKLINVIAAGVGKWLESYNSQPSKIGTFIERYDTVVSDARLAYRPL